MTTLNTAEVAASLRKSTRFVRDEIHRGHLIATYIGGTWEIEQADLDAYRAERRTQPAAAPKGRRRPRRSGQVAA